MGFTEMLAIVGLIAIVGTNLLMRGLSDESDNYYGGKKSRHNRRHKKTNTRKHRKN